ncbi:type VI secretion system Vgr family protein, partial [Morganella morganii]|uniref:type VI secretion system Vgr family protein n=1 Tax=Morganella morganii TaxID=582 RepID=UPI0021A28E9D
DAPGKPFTQLRYEQSQNHRQTGTAGINCFALRPGKVFSLKNHPSADMNAAWQVISVSHRGVQPLADNSGGEGTTFSNTVQFIPGTQEWRPPFRYKPTADGDELATVVGPPGEEIYTNEQGAVKVYFHWDRRGNPDHSASCWLRVAHGWNGNGYGFMSVPRIGQEVIVSYLNGDIDKPIITGCTYNGRNNPPLNLPQEKTRTTFRTQTHKGDGFNELRFEDEAGQEEVYIHAQKDMNAHVEHDATWHIQHDLKRRIDNNSHTELTGDEHVIISGSQKHQTSGDVSLHIKGEQHTRADKNLVTESGQQTHHLSDGKIIIEAGTEITLKVGDSFIRITPGAIFTSGNLNVGDSAPGNGVPVRLMPPEGVPPAPEPYPVKKYCAVAAQTEGSWVIKSGGGNGKT